MRAKSPTTPTFVQRRNTNDGICGNTDLEFFVSPIEDDKISQHSLPIDIKSHDDVRKKAFALKYSQKEFEFQRFKPVFNFVTEHNFQERDLDDGKENSLLRKPYDKKLLVQA